MDVEAPYLPASGYLARHIESSPAKILLGDAEFLGQLSVLSTVSSEGSEGNCLVKMIMQPLLLPTT